MSNPIWVGSGGCPVIKVLATTRNFAASFIGWAEFGEQSMPPNYYRNYSTSGPGWSWTNNDGHHIVNYDSGVPNGTAVGNNADGSSLGATGDYTASAYEYTYSGDTLIDTSGGSGPAFIISAIPGVVAGAADGVASAASLSGSINDPLVTWESPNGVSVSIDSKTQLTLTQPGWTNPPAPPNESVTSGTFVLTLNDPDTAADAVTRGLALVGDPYPVSGGPFGPEVGDIFSAGIFTLYENRSTTAKEKFGYQDCAIQLVVGQVIPGILYHPVVVIESRDAVGDGSGGTSGYGSTWTSYGTLSIADFRPTDTTYTTAAVSLPTVAGKQLRIKSIHVTPISG